MIPMDPGTYMPDELCFILAEDLGAPCAFVPQADLSAVLILDCAKQQPVLIIEHLVDHIRAGKRNHHGGATGADHLEFLLSIKGHRILVVPNCCGSLTRAWQEALNAEHPDTTWVFLKEPKDYGGSISMHHDLVDHLVSEGLLVVKQELEEAA